MYTLSFHLTPPQNTHTYIHSVTLHSPSPDIPKRTPVSTRERSRKSTGKAGQNSCAARNGSSKQNNSNCFMSLHSRGNMATVKSPLKTRLSGCLNLNNAFNGLSMPFKHHTSCKPSVCTYSAFALNMLTSLDHLYFFSIKYVY